MRRQKMFTYEKWAKMKADAVRNNSEMLDKHTTMPVTVSGSRSACSELSGIFCILKVTYRYKRTIDQSKAFLK